MFAHQKIGKDSDMKTLYLIRKQYSRLFVRELSFVSQIAILIVLLTPIIARITQLTGIIKLADNLNQEVVFFQADDYYFMPEFLDDEEYQAYFDEIKECEYIDKIGLTAKAGCLIGDDGISVYFYNQPLVESISLYTHPVENENNAVPAIISHQLSRDYNIGDIIVPASTLQFVVSGEQIEMQFIVVGVMEGDNNYIYDFVGGASNVMLESIGHSDEQRFLIALGSFNMVPLKDISSSCLLFTKDENQEKADAINESIGHLGHAESIETMRKNSLDYILTTNPIPFFASLLLFLLCISSSCSYAYVSIVQLRRNISIYFICGLSKRKAIAITLSALFLLLIVGILISFALLPIFADSNVLHFICFPIALITFLFVMMLFVVLTQYNSVNPVKLMHKGD